MLSQTHLQSLRPFNNFNKFPVLNKIPPTFTTSRALYSVCVQCSTTSLPATGDPIRPPVILEQETHNTTESLVAAAPPIAVAGNLGFRSTPELGLRSLLFILSMAFGAFFSVAVVSLPTLIAFRRLDSSVKNLSKVVSEEVPGTLSSLKLSSMELNELTQQLSSLRHKISGVRIGKKDGNVA